MAEQASALMQRESDDAWRAAYARDYEAGIRRAELSGLDTAYFLGAMRGEAASPRIDSHQNYAQALADMPSLQTIGQKLGQLRNLANELQRRYRLRAPHSVGGDYIHVEDPAVPATPVDNVISSWRSIQDAVSAAPGILIDAPRTSARPTDGPRRWRRPIRIASTGNAEYDAIVAYVVREFRRANPRLPIDELSFPNPVIEANVFLDWRGVQCREETACRLFDTQPALHAANQRHEMRAVHSALLHALAFFGQLQAGRWSPQSEIVPLSAYAGLHVGAAWLRIGGRSGEVNAAVCTNVTGLGIGGSGDPTTDRTRGLSPNVRNEIRSAIRACLGAVMGASSVAPQWSVRMVPVFRTRISAQPGTYSQEDMLRQIYR